jgi:alcohol dehydrogenase
LAAFPTPEPVGGEILVEVAACTLCGSDLHTIQGKRVEPTPTVLGHEILGRVVAFGPTAPRRDLRGEPIEPGTRVIWSIVANCGDCFYCGRDLPQKCERKHKYGHMRIRGDHGLSGGLAEHCLLVEGTSIVCIPQDLSDETACPASCATSTVAAALEAAGSLSGRSILIMGCGMLGVTAAAWASTLGSSIVIASDTSGDRRELCQAFGADVTERPEELADRVAELTEGRGVDAILELTGSPDAFELVEPLARIGGTIILVGSTYSARAVSISLEHVVRRCSNIRGLHNYAPRHLMQALSFLDNHREFPFDSLVGPWLPFEDLGLAFDQGLDRSRLRIGVRPG